MSRKFFLSLLLLLPLLLSAASAAYQPGDAMEDFAFTTTDGASATLFEVLEDKDMALINLWATWCPPCKAEFPHMQAAYEKYQDRVEIIALSTEATDTLEKLAAFKAEQGLTFPVGRDEAYLAQKFGVTGIPTSVVVDRFGTICYVASGAMPDAASFERLFDAFVGEGYTRSVVWTGLPGEKPSVAASAPEDIAAALEAGDITFTADAYAYAWPMTVAEADGRSVVRASNAGQAESQAVLHAHFTAQAGDAAAVTLRADTYPVADLLHIRLDGQEIKAFGGDTGWVTYAIPLAEGSHTLTLSYEKLTAAADDAVYIDSLALLTGDAARAALAANTAYPTAEATALEITTPSAREIIFDDPTGILERSFGAARYYILHGDQAEFTAHLAADIDPHASYAFTNFDSAIHPMIDALSAQGYTLASGVDTNDTTGYPFSAVHLYPSATADAVATAVFFADEANADALVQTYFPSGAWAYAQAELSRAADGPALYRVTILDQHGAPVPGAMVQICDESLCQVIVTGEDGAAAIEMEGKAYEIHLLMLPQGYSGDLSAVWMAGAEGGEVTIAVEKE